MEWIKCTDRLPIQRPEGLPTMNWCLVTSERKGTDEPWPVTIARYTDKGWDFWDNKTWDTPCFGDTAGAFFTDEVTHWAELTQPFS